MREESDGDFGVHGSGLVFFFSVYRTGFEAGQNGGIPSVHFRLGAICARVNDKSGYEETNSGTILIHEGTRVNRSHTETTRGGS